MPNFVHMCIYVYRCANEYFGKYPNYFSFGSHICYLLINLICIIKYDIIVPFHMMSFYMKITYFVVGSSQLNSILVISCNHNLRITYLGHISQNDQI